MLSIRNRFGVIAALAFGGFTTAAGNAAIWYVDDGAPGGGTGTSWASPFNTLQAALTAAAVSGDEIRVGRGTYKPAGPGGSRSASFAVNKSVTIKGGYCGFDDPLGNPPDITCAGPGGTIFSGDLNGNDAANFANNAENSTRVVTVSGIVTVRLENLTISGGNANAVSLTGGGLFVAAGATITCDRVNFTDNHADSWGGAIDHNGTPISVYKYCLFDRNRAGGYGGAVSLSSGNGARMGMCKFHRNTLTAATTGTGGGALWINGPSSIINCLFTGNSATATAGSGGGAIAVGGSAGATSIINCSLASNTSNAPASEVAYGIASYAGGPGPVITNCLFHSSFGYYVDQEIRGNVQASYCLNSGETGTANSNNISLFFIDFEGFDNVGGTPDDDLTLSVTYGYGPGVDAANRAALPADIMDLDNDGNVAEAWPTTAVFTTDFLPNRFQQHGPTPDGPVAGSPPLDIGAFEFRGSGDVPGPVIYVDDSGTADLGSSQGSGATWNGALFNLTNAITLANAFPGVVNEIRIGAGVYRQFVTGYVTRPGLTIRGGFAGRDSAAPDTRDSDAFATIFDGDVDQDDPPYLADISLPLYNDNTAFHITAYAAAAALTVDGLRLRNLLSSGAVFDTSECNITLRDIQASRCYFGGGFLLMYSSVNTASLTDCTLDNIIYDISALAWIRTGATLRAVNCRVTDANQDTRFSTFAEGPGRPGSIVWHESAATSSFVNCLFNNNEAAHGPVIFADSPGSSISFTNCTLVNNRARYSGGTIFYNGGLPQISNSILWGNTAPAYPQMYFSGTPGSSTFQYSIIQGGVSQGTSVLSSNPLFADADGPDNTPGNADDDFRLRLNSPAIDLGSVSALPLDTNDLDRDINTAETLPLDLDFLPRNLDMDFDSTPEPDAGAFESFSSAVINVTANTTHATIAEAVTASASGQTILAPSSQFTAEPFIDFAGKAITIGGTSSITQPTGGRYTLTDGAILGRPTSSFGPSLTLNGELRVPAGASAFVNASSLTNNSAINVFDNASLNAAVPGATSGAGNLRLYSGATFSTTGSLSASGVVNALTGSTLSTVGALTVASTSNATLQGTTVVSGGAASISGITNWTGSSFTAPSLSISSSGRFTGSGSVYANTLNSGRIYTVGNTLFVGSLTNNASGIITVQLGTATLIGSLTNNGTINGILSNPPLPPPDADDDTIAFYRSLAATERTAPGDGLFIRGDYTAGPASSLSLPNAVWRLTVAGSYDSAINSSTAYDMRQAELVMAKPDTGPSALEAMSLDRGAVIAGLDRSLASSYPIGTLRIGGAAVVSTTDTHDNALDGQAACEAVYCENLVIEAGATLSAPSCRVYYRNLTNNGSITNPSNVIRIPPPCPTDLNGDGITNTTDLTLFLVRFGQTAAPGSFGEIADINDDGIVNTTDLTLLLVRFGQACG